VPSTMFSSLITTEMSQPLGSRAATSGTN
jgi:hypothetical protein